MTSNTLKISVEELFTAQKIWPVIVVEEKTKKAVSLQEVNLEAFQKTLETGQCWYYDRVNDCIYLKGEHSNEIETLKEVTLDICHARRHLRNLHYLVDIAPGACLFGMKKCDFYKFDGQHFTVDEQLVIDAEACEKHRERVNTFLSESDDAEHQKRFMRKK